MADRTINGRVAHKVSADTVRIERVLPGSPERLWSYLVDADKRRLWFSGGDTMCRPGDRTTLVFNHSVFADEPTPEAYKQMDAGGIRFEVEVTAFEPPSRLAYTWPEDDHVSEVVFELSAHGPDVRLVLTHRRLRDGAQMANVSSGWHAHLDVLGDLLEGRKSKGFWSKALGLQADYARMFGA